MSSYLKQTQKKANEFFIFKQIKVMIPHSQLHSLDFFLLHLLPLTVFIFLLKWCGNFTSDVTGNRELFQWQQILVFRYCITAASSWLLARDHDKWLEAPRGTPPPWHKQSPPSTLPNVSHKLKLAKARCSGFLTSGWKHLLKTTWPYSYHIGHIIQRFVFLCVHLSCTEVCLCGSNNAVRSQSASP